MSSARAALIFGCVLGLFGTVLLFLVAGCFPLEAQPVDLGRPVTSSVGY